MTAFERRATGSATTAAVPVKAAVIAIAAFAAAVLRAASPAVSPAEGEPSPADCAPKSIEVAASAAPVWSDLKWDRGGPVDLESLRGRPVLVGVWGEGFSGTDTLTSLLVRLDAEHGARGLAVVGVCAASAHTTQDAALFAEAIRRAAKSVSPPAPDAASARTFQPPIAIDTAGHWLRAPAAGPGPRACLLALLDASGVVRRFEEAETVRPDDLAREIAAAFDPSPPEGWRFESPRPETAALRWVEQPQENGGRPELILGLAGGGKDFVDGRWIHDEVIEPGKCYAFRVRFRPSQVKNLERSVLARVVWLDAEGRRLAEPEYPGEAQRYALSDSWRRLEAQYSAPAAASRARIELHLRWAPEGRVLWKDAALVAAEPTPPRRVRLATVNHRPRGSTTAANLEKFAALIDEAARGKADVVCLPEGVTLCGTSQSYATAAEAVPGPTTQALGKAAARGRIYVVAGVYERVGPVVYNTSVLIGRDGDLAGKYRKVCLPREEIDGGVTPGKEYPVFATDFGKLGMMICWDVHFPEVARELSARGAELILLPIWGGNETLARARAIENQIYVVASGYDFRTCIIDPKGELAAAATRDPEVVYADVDLNARHLWPWLGDWRSRIWREAPAREAPRGKPEPAR